MRRAEKYSETEAFGEWQRWVDENVAQKSGAHLPVKQRRGFIETMKCLYITEKNNESCIRESDKKVSKQK